MSSNLITPFMKKKIKIIELTGKPIPSEYKIVKLTAIAEGVLGHCAKLLSGSKTSYRKKYPTHKVFFNANIFTQEDGKIWFGDIDLTFDEKKLKKLSVELDKEIFLLKEMDGRFENENVTDLTSYAVWRSGYEKRESY